MLRTNLAAESAAHLWQKYMQLTKVEAAFRALKSELAIRPLFHQLEKRVKAHVMVAFIGYALLVALKHLLKRKQAGCSPAQAIASMSKLHSADIVLPTVDGREIRLRRITEPETEQRTLLHALQIHLPTRLDPVPRCSVDSAIA
jgi:transposase